MFEFTEPIVEGNLPKLISANNNCLGLYSTSHSDQSSNLENFLPKRRTHRQRAVDCCRSSTGFVWWAKKLFDTLFGWAAYKSHVEIRYARTKKPWLFRGYTQFCGDYNFINYRIPMKQPMQWKVRVYFFFRGPCSVIKVIPVIPVIDKNKAQNNRRTRPWLALAVIVVIALLES